MKLSETIFELEDLAAGRVVLDELGEEFGGEFTTSPSDQRFTFYDTFDWRLHSAGLRLRVARRGGRYEAVLSREPFEADRRSEGTVATASLESAPGLIAELVEGRLRNSLDSIVEMRRLEPAQDLELRGKRFAVLDDERKTRVRVLLEEGRARRSGSRAEWSPLSPTLRVVPLKGYGKDFRRVVRFLERTGLSEVSDSLFSATAAAVGLAPGSYSSKLALDLDPTVPAAKAMAAIYRGLLDVIRVNERGVRADIDSEFLHDYRVSVRRTRVGLSQMKSCLASDQIDGLRRGFSWLGKITGPTRDLDVYLLKMPSYRKKLPKAARRDLDPLSEYLRRHQRLEQRKMARALATPRYRSLISDWERFLDRVDSGEDWGVDGRRPIEQVAAERIWKIYRRVIKKGSAIGADSPADPIHRLRIDCKKLRYLMEFFRGLFPADEIGLSIKALKSLQDNLGDFNDYEVQQISLMRFSHEMVEEDLAPVETLMAIGRLVERLEEGQAHERKIFHRRFDRFADRENAAHFRNLFKRRSQEREPE